MTMKSPDLTARLTDLTGPNLKGGVRDVYTPIKLRQDKKHATPLLKFPLETIYKSKIPKLYMKSKELGEKELIIWPGREVGKGSTRKGYPHIYVLHFL